MNKDDPLLLPERRTEADWQLLAQALAANTHTESREVEPGVWQHTFTPDPGILAFTELKGEQPEMAQLAGAFSLGALSQALDEIYAGASANSHMMLVSVETTRQIRHFYRIGRLYLAHPIPRYKIRKCHMRKIHRAWRKGRAHIRRVEQAERAREEAAMRARGN